jgi:hypothetical protein
MSAGTQLLPQAADLHAYLAVLGDGMHLYALFDSTRVRGLKVLLRELPFEHECLYRGDAARELAHVAPFLAALPLDRNDPWNLLVLQDGMLESALFVASPAGLPELHTHFRRFLQIRDSQNRKRFFRFYDPRVIGPFLEMSNPEERGAFFGPVYAFAAVNVEIKEYLSLTVWLDPARPEAARPPDAHHPFRLRPEQEEEFARDRLARYEQRCLAWLRAEHAERLGDVPDEEIKKTIERARREGPPLGITAGRDISWLAESILLGTDEKLRREMLSVPTYQRQKWLEDFRKRSLAEVVQ